MTENTVSHSKFACALLKIKLFETESGIKVRSMSKFSRVLYLIPMAVASGAIAVSVIAPIAARASTPNLSPVSSNQLITWIQNSRPIPLSGTVVVTSSFPIPSLSGLPSVDPGGSLTGSSSFSYNIWTNGKGSFRSQQVTHIGESDLYLTPGSLWLWKSSTLTATKEVLPTGSLSGTVTPSTPEMSATEILQKLSAFSTIGVSSTTTVAGRPAYTLIMVPAATDTLIGSIQIAIDALTHTPLQIQVFAKGASTPSASLGFATVSFTTPASNIFGFSPPPDAKVVLGSPQKSSVGSSTGLAFPQKVGSGFDTVIVSSTASSLSFLQKVEGSLPVVSTPFGDAHLYVTPLVEALILSNGKVLVGAVDTARLVQVASAL